MSTFQAAPISTETPISEFECWTGEVAWGFFPLQRYRREEMSCIATTAGTSEGDEPGPDVKDYANPFERDYVFVNFQENVRVLPEDII